MWQHPFIVRKTYSKLLSGTLLTSGVTLVATALVGLGSPQALL
jgi:hypothetical protein